MGRANATNPMPLVIPCHRVIGSLGQLTGFGGGLKKKAEMLGAEGIVLQRGRVPAKCRNSLSGP